MILMHYIFRTPERSSCTGLSITDILHSWLELNHVSLTLLANQAAITPVHVSECNFVLIEQRFSCRTSAFYLPDL